MQQRTIENTMVSTWAVLVMATGIFFVSINKAEAQQYAEYQFWKSVGASAAVQALDYMNIRHPRRGDFIALTNAGYSEVNGQTTQAALDGLSQIIGVRRGDFSLVEIHSNAESSLWFAVFYKNSGVCTYLEVNPDAVSLKKRHRDRKKHLFSTIKKTNITADHIFGNPTESAAIFESQIFNGNEFRIVTVVNGILASAPANAIRAMEFHDHYCPGVTSGVILTQYLKKYLSLDFGSKYFVQSVRPWCKEDALLSILNTTPGKKSYHLLYPTEEDIAQWKPEARDAANIIYWSAPQSSIWNGVVLGITLPETDCPSYNNTLLDKLCSDLYYLNLIDSPESFVHEIKRFALPEGLTPQDYARPGVDPMKRLGLIETAEEE